jgi:hypothetical protein
MAVGDLSSARRAFLETVRLAPDNDTYRKRLQLVEQVMALNPTLRGLQPADRFQRSRKLLEAAVGALERCLPASPAAVPKQARSLADAARKTLLRRVRPRSYRDEVDSNITLAQQIWGERIDICGPAPPGEDPLSRVMAQLSQ